MLQVSIVEFVLVTLLSLFSAGDLFAAKEDKKGAELLVTITTTTIAAPAAMDVKLDRDVCGSSRKPLSTILDPTTHGLQNVVVWIDGPNLPRWATGAAMTATISTKGCEFEPRIVILQPGGTLTFTNPDQKILHSYRAQAKTNPPVYRVHPPNLKYVQMKFMDPEIIPITNDMHPWMQAFAVVAPHPFYQKSDAQGKVRLRRIPPGKYKLSFWHEMLGSLTYEKEILITDKSTQEAVNFEWPPQQ